MIKTITGNYTLNVDDSWRALNLQEIYLQCNTSLGAVNIDLFEIIDLDGFWNVKIFITDISNNASVNNIVVNASGSDIIDSTGTSSSTINLNGGLPLGGNYSGLGVAGNVFSPVAAGAGLQVITYTYTDPNNCTNADTSTIEVFALPTVTLDTFAVVCNGLVPFNLTGGNPLGGTYAGSGVVGGNQFDPTINGAGNFQISYIY
jgi:hypothetical protein